MATLNKTQKTVLMVCSIVMLVAYLFFSFVNVGIGSFTMLDVLAHAGMLSRVIGGFFVFLLILLSLTLLLGPMWILLFSLKDSAGLKGLAPCFKPGGKLICMIPLCAYLVAFLFVVIGVMTQGGGGAGFLSMLATLDFWIYLPAAIVAFIFGSKIGK